MHNQKRLKGEKFINFSVQMLQFAQIDWSILLDICDVETLLSAFCSNHWCFTGDKWADGVGGAMVPLSVAAQPVLQQTTTSCHSLPPSRPQACRYLASVGNCSTTAYHSIKSLLYIPSDPVS